ncbi:MAG: ribosome-associated translation inhibitor RaiA [Planctomycetota bacterium]|nr:MAG: ribosome-associated translation inhibitor RaiA [Planctomycetota bacterium]
MQVEVSTRHGHLSEASKQSITAKAERLLRLFDRLTSIEVTVDLKDEQKPSVDLRVSAEHKHDFVATEQAAGLMAAFDGALHKVEHQLRKYKEKVQDHHRSPRHEAASLESPEESE